MSDKEWGHSGNSIQHHFKYYLAGSTALITLLAYLPSLRNEFVNWDDDLYIINNTFIRLLDIDLFRRAFWGFYASNWHPLTWLSHAVDYAIWGLNPAGHHLSNIILHAINTFLVVLLVVKLLASRQAGKPTSPQDVRFSLIAAVTTGLLFGIHPIHVESVAWVAERKDLLCALFFLLSIIMYTRYLTFPSTSYFKREWQKRRLYLLSLLFCALALLSKPMAVTLPFVLLIVDWHPFGRIRSLKALRSVFYEKLPFIALSLGSSILTVLAQGETGAIQSARFAPLSTRLLVSTKSLAAYLWKILLPLDLVPFNPYPQNVSFLSSEYLAAAAVVAGITAICIVMAKKNRKLCLSAWGYYVLTLVPVLGIVQVGSQSMADRYTYLPSLGPFLIAGAAVAWVSGKANTLTRRGKIIHIVGGSVIILVFVSLSYLTNKQIGIWRNSIDLWNAAIKNESATDPYVYYGRGGAFAKLGLHNRAITDYSRAIALSRSYYARERIHFVYFNRGMTYMRMGQIDKAISDFSRAIAFNPSYYKAYDNRGIAYYSNGQYDRAMEDFNRAILSNQNDAVAYLNRGVLYLSIGNRDTALSDFRKACDLGNQDACARAARFTD